MALPKNVLEHSALYLAAVLRLRSEISDDITFLGLTTVAPVDAHTRAVVRGVPNEPGVDQKLQPPPTGAAGMTLGGICISSLVDGKVVSNGRPIDVEPELAKWHIRFRNNVAACRRAAAPNGPHHCEIHVQNKGDGPTGSSHNARTEPSLTEALKFVEIIVEKEKQKDHTACRDHCTIVAFSL
ncbi:hypothetical protein MKEN_00020100 [Mycena kentingensis (nom. inval.)]|nr:hypothetical protein MKEN_00020100 [Mycena kentingensis (nom. inval.)]